jgi:hypothetical protein
VKEESRPARRLPDNTASSIPEESAREIRVNINLEGRRSSWTAKELMLHDFPDPRYAVPGVLAEGLNLFAGAPKLGKSWFALNVAAAVAYGGLALDKISVERGEALYLALEDPPRRLQRRLQLILGGEPAPDGLFIETAWDKLLEGGRGRLDAWLDAHPDCRLVVVDVFVKVRGIPDANVNRYEADYTAMASLKTLADKHGVAILVVHHTRKALADDYIDSVSGTQGLAGAADAVLVLSRSRGSADAKLRVTGRDIEETEYALRFSPEKGSWSLLEGPAEEYEVSDSRRRILVHLRENGPRSPKQLSDELGLDHDAVRQTVSRMARDEQIATDGDGLYYHLSQQSHLSHGEESGVTPVTGVTGDTEGQGALESTNDRVPTFGDVAYLDYIATVHRNGHLTTDEALELEQWHKRVLEAGGERH